MMQSGVINKIMMKYFFVTLRNFITFYVQTCSKLSTFVPYGVILEFLFGIVLCSCAEFHHGSDMFRHVYLLHHIEILELMDF